MVAIVSPSLICSSNSMRYWSFILTDDKPCLLPTSFSYRRELYFINPSMLASDTIKSTIRIYLRII